MKLIIFTAHYPYLPGEEYIVQELEVLSKYSQEIKVICGEKNTENERRNTPENVEVISINRKYDFMVCVLYGVIRMFSFSTFREIYYAILILNVKISIRMLKTILIYNVVSERYVRWIKKNIEKDNSNVVLYSYWLSQSAYALSRLKKSGYRFRAISRAHGYDAFLDREYQAFRRDIYRYLDEIHFVSNTGRNQFESKGLLYSNNRKAKLFTSRLGTLKQNNRINPENKKDNEEFHIVTCSSIIPLKRLDLLVDALALLRDYNIRWTHFGDGYLKEKIYNKIEKDLKDSNIIVSFKGQAENIEVLTFYENNHIDLFINSSDYEGVPVSIMEAMSYGIPILARDVGGNSEIVENKRNGLLLKKKIDEQGLKIAIEYFIKLPCKTTLVYRREAYKIWNEKYNAQYNYLDFAKKILNNN